MKFCKNLQRVADLSNPEWSPYWTDYKGLKKIIKGLSELDLERSNTEEREGPPTATKSNPQRGTPDLVLQTACSSPHERQRQGDRTAETSPAKVPRTSATNRASGHAGPSTAGSSPSFLKKIDAIRSSPGEVLFFKVLHAEFQKAVRFFDSAIEEFHIREERVVQGMAIVKKGHRYQLWSVVAKSVYRLYSDLLLLETFCIMTYCSFSKILKKHDKVTRFDTRNAFMSNVVNKANFTNYTTLQGMIGRCEQLYTEVSERMVQEGQHALYEDERLFIEMIQSMNQQPV